MQALEGRRIPATLISQHLAAVYPDVVAGRVKPLARNFIRAALWRVLDVYSQASRRGAARPR